MLIFQNDCPDMGRKRGDSADDLDGLSLRQLKAGGVVREATPEEAEAAAAAAEAAAKNKAAEEEEAAKALEAAAAAEAEAAKAAEKTKPADAPKTKG